jgi:hypothetical protein
VATPALVWATEIGKRPTPQLFEGELEGPMFGPYAVDVRLEYATAALAGVIAVIGLAVLVRATVKKDVGLRGWAVLALVVAAGYLAAVSWRRETSGVDPQVSANIGGGLIVEAWPIGVAALVTAAVAVGTSDRRIGSARRAMLIAAAVFCAPALIAIQYALPGGPV